MSKHPIQDVQHGFSNSYDPENARLIAATVSGMRMVNVYVPQGQTTESDKFKYKLNFFAELIQEFQAAKNSDKALAIMGDFNIAPHTDDLSNPESMRGKVSFHPKEHALLAELMEIGLSDLFRKFDQRSGQFSWWDFRTRGFERDEGMRIDYILANSVLTSSCQACIIDIEAREQDRPSDHAPVIAEFKL
ncbi:MAG TPA: exodeoxyribonuclease III [Deltaproteobacteria bacterium]|nr:exodeoxyribonuclease III [Deltaproteobacteria bacterium]